MNNVYPGDSRHILEVFCLYEGEGEFFDLGKEPIDREAFSFGKESHEKTGFQINENCIQCGNCIQSCPQRCIQEGNPYEIIQRHCLHCGLCAEKCPSGAIIKIK